MKKADIQVGGVYAHGQIRLAKSEVTPGTPCVVLSTDVWRKDGFNGHHAAATEVGQRQWIPAFTNLTAGWLEDKREAEADGRKHYPAKPQATDGKGYLVVRYIPPSYLTRGSGKRTEYPIAPLKAVTLEMAKAFKRIRVVEEMVASRNTYSKPSPDYKYLVDKVQGELQGQGIEVAVVTGRELYGDWEERLDAATAEQEMRRHLNSVAEAESVARVAEKQAIVDRLKALTGVAIVDRHESNTGRSHYGRHYGREWTPDRWHSSSKDESTDNLLLTWDQVAGIISALEAQKPLGWDVVDPDAVERWEYEEGKR